MQSFSLAVFLVCLCQSKKAIHQQVLFGTVECKEVREKKKTGTGVTVSSVAGAYMCVYDVIEPYDRHCA